MRIFHASIGHHDALSGALSNVILERGRRVRRIGTMRSRRGQVGTERDDAVEIAVSDDGTGISPADLARIWEPYVTHKPGGTGLGLAIARQAVAGA